MKKVGAPTETRAEQRLRTQRRILAAARRLLSQRGFDRNTIRAVAADAQVDAALVIHYFGSKEQLFTKAVSVTVDEPLGEDPDGALKLLLARLDAKLVGLPDTTLAMMRSMLTHPEANNFARTVLDDQITALAGAIAGDDVRLRAALVMTVILGLTVGRELLGLEDLQRASPDQIIDRLRPALRTLLTDEEG